MKKQKFIFYLNKIIFSSFVLWGILVLLKIFNFKLEIKSSLFFIFALVLFTILYFQEILIILIRKLNQLNYFLKSTDKRLEIDFLSTKQSLFSLLSQTFYLLKGFPRLVAYLFTNSFFWLIITVSGIFFDVFIFKFSFDLLILTLFVFWIILVRHYKFEGRVSVGIALGLLILCPFLLIFKKDLIAEKAAIWAYLFLVIGVVQLFIENIREKDTGK